MMDENSAGCASEGVVKAAYVSWARDLGSMLSRHDRGTAESAFRAGYSAAQAINQDVPAPAAVTAEVRERFEAFVRPWRKGIAMLHDAQSHRHMCMVKPVAGGDVHEWAAAEISALRAALSAAAPLQSDLAAGFPDIGPDPMKGDRPADRLEASIAAVRAAYVKQQQGIPDQTALVWRWHIGALLEAVTRLRARAALQGADNHE